MRAMRWERGAARRPTALLIRRRRLIRRIPFRSRAPAARRPGCAHIERNPLERCGVNASQASARTGQSVRRQDLIGRLSETTIAGWPRGRVRCGRRCRRRKLSTARSPSKRVSSPARPDWRSPELVGVAAMNFRQRLIRGEFDDIAIPVVPFVQQREMSMMSSIAGMPAAGLDPFVRPLCCCARPRPLRSRSPRRRWRQQPKHAGEVL